MGQPHRAATGEDGAICIALVDGAYRSFRTHQECSIPKLSSEMNAVKLGAV
jgi:hypothetical protein